ncbi:MAG: nucleoside 2-deoxyribosyltransferase [Candidatus Iainarchaeum archaeon]|uniref:Nucleoside 2-deoxyribosyltransferase n=1 Tax=Candidatus Iainarchaeum sp. TaxID=3101447 RepID=A0A7T9I181_9ARCH|nr:MAG: nucleoside 2-deoxyribosyltransferase [Candidatus Diapherotrites archaeon]
MEKGRLKIYFARSIRGQRVVDVELLQQSLSALGEVLSEKFDFSTDASRDKLIFSTDRRMLESADVVIAEVSNPSLGVGYELGIAESLKKPVLCLALEDLMVSSMIAGNPYFVVKHYRSIPEAVSLVSDFLALH